MKGMEPMRRLLLALLALCLGINVGCHHHHIAGVCDCADRGPGAIGPFHYPHETIHLPKEMPKGQ